MNLPPYTKKTIRGKAYAYVTIDGKQRSLGRYGTKESRRRYRQILDELKYGIGGSARSPLVAEVVTHYSSSLSRALKDST